MKLLLVAVVLAIDHAKQATSYLSTGQINKALEQYDLAIAENPQEHLLYYRRATAYLTLGRTNQALVDFKQAHHLSDHQQTRDQIARILVGKGELEEAEGWKPTQEILEMLEKAKELKIQIKTCPPLAPLNEYLALCSKDQAILAHRAACFAALDQPEMAVNDYLRLLTINPNNNLNSLKLSSLYISLLELDSALDELRKCLVNNPDQKECKNMLKNTRKLKKIVDSLEELEKNQKWKQLFVKLEELKDIDYPKNSTKIILRVDRFICIGYSGQKNHKKTIETCTRVIELDNQSFDAILARAEAYFSTNQYEKALIDFKTCHEIDSENQRVINGYRKTQVQLKRVGMKDYYAILGVEKSASQREIKKAYRKMAKQYHPDKYSGEMNEKQVLEKMAEINQAHEVLSDETLRERYDQGDDPNDPDQQSRNQNPFGNGFPGGFQFQGFGNGNQQFQGFGNGNQQFQFHFT